LFIREAWLVSQSECAHDLLFGLLALQNGLISQAQLVAGFQAWTLGKKQPLADYLITAGGLDADARSAIEAMVALHLKKHGGDAGKSLASIPVGFSTCQSLAALGDSDIERSLAGVGTGSSADGDPYATVTYAVGSTTSSGQRFRVLRPHARGGLGAVFVAMDGELNREVALKEILDNYADDPVSRQRFLIEAEITGGLEHPSIVPVYGLGTYGDGRPYYAMRFIKGDSLKEAIEQFHRDESLRRDTGRRSLALRKLLRRFIDVCNAIDYAHSRGVLHRDIKPGNIIVGKHGETLVVDWGLAKATGRGDVVDPGQERPLLPSAASGSLETRAGSAFGTPAYMSPEQAAGDLDRLGVRSDVYSLGATLYSLLTGHAPFEGDDAGEILRKVQRGEITLPRRLDPWIDKALEAICLNAMANRPEDRYATCRALADDIERWAADEPVSVCRESRSARLARWSRRHRASVQTATMTLAVVAVLATTAAFIVNLARRNEEAARKKADLAREQETEARAEAQQSFALARRAVEDYFTRISENTLLKRQDAAEVRDLRSLRKELLEVALDYYKQLTSRRASSPELRAEQAAAHTRLGQINLEIGSTAAAVDAFRESEAIWSELADQTPGDADRLRDLARSRIDLAGALAEMGRDAEEALTQYGRSREILERLATAQPGDFDIQSELAKVWNDESLVLHRLGRSPEALAALDQGRAALQRLADAGNADAKDLLRLARAHANVGLILDETGRSDEALVELEKGRVLHESVSKAEPTNSTFQNELAICYNNLGLVLTHAGRAAEALSALAQARTILQRLVQAHPSVTSFRRDLATNRVNSGNLQAALQHQAEALTEFEEARAVLEPLLEADPSSLENRRDLAITLFNIGDVLQASGKFALALERAEKACAVLGAFDVRDSLEEFVLASAHDLSASMLEKLNRPANSVDRAAREKHISLGLAALDRAIKLGYRVENMGSLSALRSRAEFRMLELDNAFPDWPFAGEPPR
jgi:serine/threonine-protein kinase